MRRSAWLFPISAAIALAGQTMDAQARSDAAPPAKESKAVRLFAADEPMAMTLKADFGKVFKSRDTIKVVRQPGTLSYTDATGRTVSIAVQLAPRGHFRLMSRNCGFPPLRITFPRDEVKGTIFAGQKSLKLGTHCQKSGDYEQYTLREYLIYKSYNLLTDLSFRARLAKATYVDTRDSLNPMTRWALWIESEDDLGKRTGGVVHETRGALFADLDAAQMTMVGLFEYFTGNTDWSLFSLHNIRIMQKKQEGTYYPIAYDFDFSGLADTRYATPDPRLPIKKVRERLFRGPCRTPQELAPVLGIFNAKRASIVALYDSLPGLDKGYASWAKDYIKDFYETINDPRRAKSELGNACDGRPAV